MLRAKDAEASPRRTTPIVLGNQVLSSLEKEARRPELPFSAVKLAFEDPSPVLALDEVMTEDAKSFVAWAQPFDLLVDTS